MLTELRSLIANELEMMKLGPERRHARAKSGSPAHGALRRFVREALSDDDVMDDIGTLRPGDMVDVMGGEVDYSGVSVVSLVGDVRAEQGMPDDEDDMHLGGDFSGPGFVGRTDEGDELVFSLNQVVPGSKAKYYFPSDGEPSTGY